MRDMTKSKRIEAEEIRREVEQREASGTKTPSAKLLAATLYNLAGRAYWATHEQREAVREIGWALEDHAAKGQDITDESARQVCDRVRTLLRLTGQESPDVITMLSDALADLTNREKLEAEVLLGRATGQPAIPKAYRNAPP